MSFENPDADHSVNAPREHVGLEFLQLLGGLAVVVALLSAAVLLFGGWAARRIPPAWEAQLVGGHVVGLSLPEERAAGGRERARIAAYLQTLADRMAPAVGVPAGLPVRVHVVDEDTPNAFATLGGHVVITRGLYTRMPSENAMAMVLGHELGHLQARDPIAALGGRGLLALLLGSAGGDGGALAAVLSETVARGYSRDAERRADGAGLRGLQALYGHVRGSAEPFRVFSAWRKGQPLATEGPTMLSTHPTDAERIARLEQAERQSATAAPPVPLREPWPSPRSGLHTPRR